MLLSMGVRVKREGRFPDNNNNYIYMFNHSSFIDVFIFGYSMKVPCAAIIATENYKYPIWNSMLKRWKAIPIERKNKESAIESIKAAEKILNTGISVVILPEGTRTVTGNLSRFKKGGFHMAYNTKVPIVPVGSIGAFEFKPKNRWTLSPREITINYGEPIDPNIYDSLGVNGLLKHTEQEMKRLTNRKFEDEC